MYRDMDTAPEIKFTLLLIPILFFSVCATTPKISDNTGGEKTTTAKPIKGPTMKSVAGTYEDKTLHNINQYVSPDLAQLFSEDATAKPRKDKVASPLHIFTWNFLENGLIYKEWNNIRSAEGKWKLEGREIQVNGETHSKRSIFGPRGKYSLVFTVNEDASITCTEMTVNGEQRTLPKNMHKIFTYKRIK